ncbi:MAG: TlpA family protein disulfide reductase [Alphaproteobacteria bacterium]|nr:TlpA family protein disulfide reductase [Alphaproteobacteria bacterium]
MNKILSTILIFIFFVVSVGEVKAKINIFPNPRYIPALSFYGESGKAYRLTDFKEDMLMAVVWSRRCGPCVADLKHLKMFAKRVEKQGIKVILISPESEWKTADERRLFMKRVGGDGLVNYLDRKANFRDGMGLRVTPTVILVNKNGEEMGQITGSVDWDDEDVIEYMINLKNDELKKLDKQKSANEQNQK